MLKEILEEEAAASAGTDGGYGDLGVIPTSAAGNKNLKKDDEGCDKDSKSKALNDECKKKLKLKR